MSGINLNLESQNIIQMLMDKVIFMKSSNNYENEVDLLTQACKEVDVKLNKFFREDISNIFMYCCQIMLNENICIMTASGKSKEESFKNAVRKFIRYTYNQKNQIVLPSVECDTSFVDEIIENFENMKTIDNFISICKTCFTKNTNSINSYANIKRRLENDNDLKLMLSESYRPCNNKPTICSIFLNGNLLLQQGIGKNNEDALENTITEMFKSYSISSESIVEYCGDNVSTNVQYLIWQLAVEFNRNKNNSTNHWLTIQKCAKDLNINLNSQFINKTCIVKINDIEICNVSGENEYCAYIKACREIIGIFTKKAKEKEPQKENRNKNVCQTLINDTPKDNTSAIGIIMMNIINKRTIEPLKDCWTIVNEEFIKDNNKLELKYTKEEFSKNTTCTFFFKGIEIVSENGIDRNISRRNAALKLIQTYTDSI